MRHSEHRRIDVEQGEVADAIDTLKRMLQDLQNSMGPESLDVQTLRGRCAEPYSNRWPITTRSAITRASRTGSCSPCRIEKRAGITELYVARNDWVVC